MAEAFNRIENFQRYGKLNMDYTKTGDVQAVVEKEDGTTGVHFMFKIV